MEFLKEWPERWAQLPRFPALAPEEAIEDDLPFHLQWEGRFLTPPLFKKLPCAKPSGAAGTQGKAARLFSPPPRSHDLDPRLREPFLPCDTNHRCPAGSMDHHHHRLPWAQCDQPRVPGRCDLPASTPGIDSYHAPVSSDAASPTLNHTHVHAATRDDGRRTCPRRACASGTTRCCRTPRPDRQGVHRVWVTH